MRVLLITVLITTLTGCCSINEYERQKWEYIHHQQAKIDAIKANTSNLRGYAPTSVVPVRIVH